MPIRPIAYSMTIAPLLAAGILPAFGLAATAALADAACSATPVSAQGEPAGFEWLAKTKARANWRAKVRAISDLGPDYANWNIAADRAETCEPGENGIACLFTGTPCKK